MPFALKNATPYKFGICHGFLNPPQQSLTLIVKGAFQIVHGEPATVHDEQQDMTGDVLGGDGMDLTREVLYPSDLVPFKPRGEVMVQGTCHPAGGAPVQVCRVALQGASINKQLDVVGDRVWQSAMLSGATISDPEPFARMPIDITRAYGGGEPGKQYPYNMAGRGFGGGDPEDQPLPNVELKEDRILSPSSSPLPATLGPLSPMWQPRSDKLGTYDAKYLRDNYPFMAEDFDWSFYNAAPADQQLSGYLNGDEEIALLHLHPAQAELRAVLPGIRLRLFCVMHKEPDDGASLLEAKVALDTLYLTPDDDTMLLTWRGAVDVSSELLPELKEIWVVEEPLDKPKTVEQCREEANEAWKRDNREESDEGAQEGDADSRMQELLAALSGVGLGVISAASRLGGSGDEAVEAPEEELTREDVQTAQITGKGLKRRLIADLDLSGLNLEGLVLDDANLSNVNLEGAILHRARLSGVTFEKCNCKSADLTGARLEHAMANDTDFSGAELTAVSGSGATFNRCGMERCSFVNAELDTASFYGSKLIDASFKEANLTGAALNNCEVGQADFQECVLVSAQFSAVACSGNRFIGADLSGGRFNSEDRFENCDFRGVIATGSMWDGSQLTKCDFTGARLERACFELAKMEQLTVTQADLQGASFMRGEVLNSDFSNANFYGARLQKTILTGVDLRGSNLYGADVVFAVMSACDLTGANTTRTIFEVE